MRMIPYHNSQNASALMVVLVTTTAMMMVALSGAKILMLQFANIRGFSNSRAAFYGAEAGLEQGLWQYRQDRQKEKTESNFVTGLAGLTTSYSSTFKGTSDSGINIGQDQGYWLQVGDNLPGGTGYFITYSWDWAYTNPLTALFRVSKVKETATGYQFEDVYAAHRPPETGQDKQIPFDSNTRIIRFRSYGGAVNNLRLICTTSGAVNYCWIAKQNTTVDSTATFGGIKRRLQAQINRQTGTLHSLFDYTLFSRSNID